MVHGARRESLGGWNEISYSWGIRSRFGSISNFTKTKLRSKARSCGIPRPGRPGRDGSHSESLSKTHFWQTIERHAAPVCDCPARLLHMDLTGEVTAGGRHFCSTFVHRGATSPPHGRILYEHARTTNAPRQAPVNRSVSVSNAPMRPVGVTCAQPAVGSSRSREPTGNLHEIARSRRARLCL